MSVLPNQMIFQMQNTYPYMMNQQPSVSMVPKNVTTLYIGDLDEQINEEYLYQKFSQFGHLFSLKIAKDGNKKSKGFAFIAYYQKTDGIILNVLAEKAKNATNHEILLMNRIRVSFIQNIKELQNEANIFVKNIPSNINPIQFDKLFENFGPIISTKLNCNKQGSPGYGYVQFVNKESVFRCLEAQKAKKFIFAEQTLECIPFEKRDIRNQTKTNIYLKNLPELSEQELTQVLSEKCKKFGEIASLLVRKDPQIQKAFAFVCFSKAEQAEKAFQYLNQVNLFDSKDPKDMVYVNWAQTRHERNKKLKDLYNSVQNETNLYLKNLKLTVTKQILEKVFNEYGIITCCDVKTPNVTAQLRQPAVNTQFAFVNFANKEDAKNALINSKYNSKVLDFFEDPKLFYITYHQNKNKLASFQQIRSRQFQASQQNMNMQQMNMSPYHMQMMFQQMNQLQQQMGGMYNMGGMNMGGMNMGMGQQNMMSGMNPNMRNQGMRNMGGYRQQRNNQQPSRPIQNKLPLVEQQKCWTVEILKEQLDEFMKYDQEIQRSILGELLFPKIKALLKVNQVENAPKITGMLIDFEVFEVADIIEFLESQSQLSERVSEAEELIKQQQ